MRDSTAWAHFGDAGGRHGLVDSEGIDDETLRAIRWHTDQPPEAPSQWSAYFAGYPIRDHYVVQFTQPDDQASRPGMVKTTLTAVHDRQLSQVSLTQLRCAAIRATGAVTAASHERVDGLGGTLELLARSQPVYWLGSTSFDSLVDQLWDVLNSCDRAALVFGMLFTPTRHSVSPQRDHRARYVLGTGAASRTIPPRLDHRCKESTSCWDAEQRHPRRCDGHRA